MEPAVAKKCNAIQKELLKKSLDKDILEYLFVQMVILGNLSFSLVQNHIFYIWLKYINLIINE